MGFVTSLFLRGRKTATPSAERSAWLDELTRLPARAAADPLELLRHRQDNARCAGARWSARPMALASAGSLWRSSKQKPITSVTDLPMESTIVSSAPAASSTLTLPRIAYPAA